ncbi:FUSC family protein [Hafnia alvei]|uniref:FUSC family protein n=1 Tax=Hafnia alvei TaxID=569 RepID=UPI001033BD32|nr:FUSC family protein [Hafnia alvei]MDU3154590.1 FUSC family protein [Hafnia alvei]TBL44422.1 FUSC family protein [Hafnia alvei]
MTANNALSKTLRQVHKDLRPFPGRFATTWRIGLLSALMSFVAMFYGIPESAISCYLILFVMKPDGVLSIIMAIAIIILVTLVVGIILLLLPYTLESIPLRMLVLIASSFFFLWLGAASKLGEVGSIVALVIAFIMGLIGIAPDGELATRAILYCWLMVASPMLLLIIFNLLMGRWPVKILYANLAERVRLAEAALRKPDRTHLHAVHLALAEGQAEIMQRAILIRCLHLGRGSENIWLTTAVYNSYRLLLAVYEQAEKLPEISRQRLIDACQSTAQSLEHRLQPTPFIAATEISENEVAYSIASLTSLHSEPLPSITKTRFMADDALKNPRYCHFALKTTLASVFCYAAYTIMDWQDIHTAMITCYVVALGTAGETAHKLTLRIVGCLIGAGLGIASLVFVVPAMSDIGQLMILVFLVLALSAWVSTGNERIAYCGIQIGLAFLLTVLHDFSPSDDLAPATGRIMGILMGNVVVYLIFTLIWPVSIMDAVSKRIHTALKVLAALAATPPTERMQCAMQAAHIEHEVASARSALKLIPFEPKNLRPTAAERQRLIKILSALNDTGRALFISQQNNHDERLSLIALIQSCLTSIGTASSTDVICSAAEAAYINSQTVTPSMNTRIEYNLLKLKRLLK